VQADDRDPDNQILMVAPPRRIGLPSKEYYENKDLLTKYQDMSAEVLKNFIEKSPGNATLNKYKRSGMSLNKPSYSMVPQTEMQSLAQGIVDLEVDLAVATPPTEDQEDVTKYYNPMTLAETEALLPQLSFQRIISQLAPKGYSPKKIIVGSPSYMKALAKLLSSTKKETLQAFLVWKAVQQYESRVEDSSLKPLRAFNNQLRGLDPSATEERWRKCIDVVDGDLGWILSKFFVEAAFSEPSKKFGDQIVSDIKDSFMKTLDDTEWMTKDVRERAIKKVRAIDQKIGYPTSNPNILDPGALKNYYSGVTISNSTFFENRVQVAQFETRQSWNKLGKPTRHDEWGMTVPTVNAYYNPAGNEIVFPAGIMQAPVFYEPSVPQYLTYGAFGAVSGHELSHAFDSTGSHYDETGNYTDWFDKPTKEAFDNRTTCFKDQYAKFTVTGPNGETLHVNGKLTLGENIADAGGLHAAYSAWKRREAEKKSLALPGLQEFTPEQLFFISYGNWWCGKSTKEKAAERIYTDPHAPKWARILVSQRFFRSRCDCWEERGGWCLLQGFADELMIGHDEQFGGIQEGVQLQE
jgi:endothelin-converting enzyme